jgi:hypothetical protein
MDIKMKQVEKDWILRISLADRWAKLIFVRQASCWHPC